MSTVRETSAGRGRASTRSWSHPPSAPPSAASASRPTAGPRSPPTTSSRRSIGASTSSTGRAWPKGPSDGDAFPAAVSALGARRESVVVCAQFGARDAADAATELRSALAALGTDYIDVLTLYYVERPDEWEELTAPGGALRYLRDAKRDGTVRRIGITSHQRTLAARMAESGLLDAVMIRYNAAHRGAERDVFPVTQRLGLPVIAYTALRWGALLRPTPDDPAGFSVPGPPDWYRFVLQHPAVAVTLSAPQTRAELERTSASSRPTGRSRQEAYSALAEHGPRRRRVSDNGD